MATREDNGGIRGYPRIMVEVGRHRNNYVGEIESGDKWMSEDNGQWWYQWGVELMMVVAVAYNVG